MKKKLLITLLFLGIFFIVISSVSALEVDYPQVPGSSAPQDDSSLANYIRYILTFILASAGIIALISLIVSGLQILNSKGDAGKLSEARSRILATFFGIIILLGSWVILNIINPQLTSLELPTLTELPGATIPPPPSFTVPVGDILIRVRLLAEGAKEAPKYIKETADSLKKAADGCDCKNTQPICSCEGSGGKDSECQPQTCYAGDSFHPCPEKEDLKKYQKSIVDQRDMILYYKSRALSEKKDIETDVKDYINKKIAWYDEQIRIEGEAPTDDGFSQKRIDFWEERKGWLEEEKQNKEKLTGLLNRLAEAIEKVRDPATKMPLLTEKCFINVAEKCQASCKKGSDYGCFDKVKGCLGDKCSGGNPCPTSEIQSEASKLNSLPQEIGQIADEIISVIDGIEKDKVIQFIL